MWQQNVAMYTNKIISVKGFQLHKGVTRVITYMKKLLDPDWLRDECSFCVTPVQKCVTPVQNCVTPVQITNRV